MLLDHGANPTKVGAAVKSCVAVWAVSAENAAEFVLSSVIRRGDR